MSLLVQRSDVSEFRRRFRWIALFMLLALLGLIVRLFYLQILESDENSAIARENIVRRITLATTRGIIRDRNGEVLAASRPSYNVYVVPRRLDMETVWPRLMQYLGVGVDEQARLQTLITAIRAGDSPRKNQQILLKEDISRDAVASLKTHEAELPGIDVVPVPVRYYPFEEVGSHVLGYMAEVDAERLATLRSEGYVEGDRLGVVGIERAWESYLRGTRGWEKVLVDARGRRRPGGEGIIDDPRRVDPIPGRDLRLTLDAGIQKSIDKAMRGQLAGGVAMVDVRTGRILGLYSKPGYDSNALSGGSGKQVIRDAFRRLYSDPLKPALDKTLSGAYPPGSTFKPFTALAALEKGLIDPRQGSQCRGALTFGKRTFRCTHVHGAVAMQRAITVSCNVYFYRLAAEYGVGMDLIAEMGQRFGFGARTGIGINAEASGRMPTKAWMTLRNKGQFRLGFGLNAAIGQGATTVTVLQLALAYAALANGGTLYQPQIVRAVETSAGTVVQEFSPRVRRQIELRPENLDLVHRAMVGGVNEEGGTAYRVRVAGVDMAGKTGTAQVSHKLARGQEAEKVWYFNREHAWFAGYAPTRAPEVAVVVLVEHGGAGGKHAAPVAFEVIRAYQELERQHREVQTKGPPKPGANPSQAGSRPGGERPRKRPGGRGGPR
ncbi:penicillin-binding protein 2 [Chondromyces crocatus]|uniref:Penicillin-binding protein 2 n=1 Tax=Chondromyces crocatus TaxID=52 RepID=A0A0K1EFV5_CHOCO|nr:penicillin-binding protein 2 [Chondromyces crocatus]AKT39729.1 penicillin-binding protein 2 [Chondromyces crocatus]